MLRITVTTRADGATVILEGRLIGPWIDEVWRTWRDLTAERDADTIRLDVDAVTFIDAAGKALLRRIHEQGSMLSACTPLTRATLQEIRKASG